MIAAPDKTEILRLSRILWDYNNAQHVSAPADVLLVMGTNDAGVAEHAAALDKIHGYPRIVVSGGVFHDQWFHRKPFRATEADMFARVMIECGVNPSKIVREMGARNTGQNVTLTREILNGFGASVATGQLVHKPMMQRRALATAERQWPEVAWRVSGQPLPIEDYVRGTDERHVFSELVANTAKILLYPDKGFQKPQHMPGEVRAAMAALIQAGFTGELGDDADLLKYAVRQGLPSMPVCATNDKPHAALSLP